MELGDIKGNKSKYFKKSENKEVTITSKYINLGVNSDFDLKETVYILSETEYKELTDINNTDTAREIAITKDNLNDMTNKYNDVIAELDNKETTIKELENKINILTAGNDDKDNTIKGCENQITTLKKELKIYTGVNLEELQQNIKDSETLIKTLNKEIKTKTDYIIYMEQLQTDYIKLIAYYNNFIDKYRTRNIINRIINTSVNLDTPQLKHIDIKGDILKDSSEPVILMAPINSSNKEDKEGK